MERRQAASDWSRSHRRSSTWEADDIPLDQGSSHNELGSKPQSPAYEADALTTGPAKWLFKVNITSQTWTRKILSCIIPSLSSSLLFSVESCNRPIRLILPRFWTLPFLLKNEQNNDTKLIVTLQLNNITGKYQAQVIWFTLFLPGTGYSDNLNVYQTQAIW